MEVITKNLAILLGVLFFAYPLFGEAAIYRCSIDGAVTYQDVPCKAGQSALTLVDAPDRASHSNSAGPLDSKQESDPRSSFQLTGLVVGMTDTEVLNLRGWGVPGKIKRSRVDRAWREEWTYFSPADRQELLQFTNGKLTGIDTDSILPVMPRRLAQMTPQ